jgi:hypothetical protein
MWRMTLLFGENSDKSKSGRAGCPSGPNDLLTNCRFLVAALPGIPSR